MKIRSEQEFTKNATNVMCNIPFLLAFCNCRKDVTPKFKVAKIGVHFIANQIHILHKTKIA